MLKFLKILIITIFIFASAGKSLISQPKYNFDFQKDWDWVELRYGGYGLNADANEILDKLMISMNIGDARILFKALSQLDSVNYVKKISELTEYDSPEIKDNYRLKIDSIFNDFEVQNTLGGLVYAVEKIDALRGKDEFGGKLFTDRELHLNIADTTGMRIDVQFDYNKANSTLDLLDKGYAAENDITYLAGLYEAPDGTYNPDSIAMIFNNAINSSPLFTIYKLVFPLSFKSLGGVSLYKEKIRSVLNKISGKEDILRIDIQNRLFVFLPKYIDYSSKVDFTLGNNLFQGTTNGNKILVNIEFYGDNFEQITKYITRRLFRQGREQVSLDIFHHLYTGSDSLLFIVMNSVHEGGMLNYIAPLYIENRPSTLLEKDFMHFRRTVKEIEKGKDKKLIDTLISNGMYGNCLFHTMGTQMTFSIEKVVGKKALKNSLMLGPANFFKSYLEAYYEDKKNIREIFRFTPDFENKINLMNDKVPEYLFSEVIEIKSKSGKLTDTAKSNFVNTEIQRVLKKFSVDRNSDVLNLLISRLLFDIGYYEQSLTYFQKALPSLKDKQRSLKFEIYDHFEKSQYSTALILSGEYIKLFPDSDDSYLTRADIYYGMNDTENAIQDLEKTLSINPFNVKANLLLEKVKQ